MCTTTAAGDARQDREALDRIGAPYMLIGGLAVIARGVVRDTDDADATVWAPATDVLVELDRLIARALGPRQQLAAARQGTPRRSL